MLQLIPLSGRVERAPCSAPMATAAAAAASAFSHGWSRRCPPRSRSRATVPRCGLLAGTRAPLSNGKSLLHSPTTGVGLHYPLNYETVWFTPWTFQNRLFYPQAVFSGGFATVTAGCYSVRSFVFFFIFAESLKNHSKSQKNHKMENLILLDSTWVDLHSEHII